MIMAKKKWKKPFGEPKSLKDRVAELRAARAARVAAAAAAEGGEA
jgi:hypothetical protein